jgi:peptidoglycan hydrolase-like protein with peptidoglycan-binding domain
MSKRMLALATSFLLAAPLLSAPGFAQAPAAPAPAAPAPAAPAPAPAAMPAPHAKPAAGMHAEMRVERIKKLQTALNASGASLTVDGKIGPKTRAALMDFQKAHGLKATGHLDKETRAALMK